MTLYCNSFGARQAVVAEYAACLVLRCGVNVNVSKASRV